MQNQRDEGLCRQASGMLATLKAGNKQAHTNASICVAGNASWQAVAGGPHHPSQGASFNQPLHYAQDN
jgi:hypothetical protein